MKRPTKKTMIWVLLGCVAVFALAIALLGAFRPDLAIMIVVIAIVLAAFALAIWLWGVIEGLLQKLLCLMP